MLGVPMLSLPGFALANLIRSASVLNSPPSLATMTRSNVRGATGVKALSVSNGSDLNSAWLTAVPLEISSSVWPSGAALATVCPATMPPAPGLFSITTGWPGSVLAMCSPTARAVMSAAPPGALGTTMRTALVGKAASAHGANTAVLATNRSFRL